MSLERLFAVELAGAEHMRRALRFDRLSWRDRLELLAFEASLRVNTRRRVVR